MRITAGTVYRYVPCALDFLDKPHGVLSGELHVNMPVRVVNLPGCPPARTMNHCHIEHPETRAFLGLVCCDSLVPMVANKYRFRTRAPRSGRVVRR